MGIGQDLLNVPFPEMVFKLANSIAQGQRVLDRSSMETARALAKAKVKVLTEFAEVISPVNRTAGGVPYTGANITMENPQYATYTLLQAGLMPTFYQFTESIIEVKISISTRSEFTSEFEIGAEYETTVETEAEAHAGFFLFGGGSAKVKTSSTFASHVNYNSSAKYSYSAEGSSLLRTTLKPVPPPPRLVPRIVTVNALKQPPEVTIT